MASMSRTLLLALLGALALGLVGVGAWAGLRVRSGLAYASQARQAVSAMEGDVQALLEGSQGQRRALASLRTHAQEVETASAQALARLGWLGMLRPLPWVGPRVQGGLALLEAGRTGGRIAQRLADALDKVALMGLGEETPGADPATRLRLALQEASPALRQAQEDLPTLARALETARGTPMGQGVSARLEALLPVVQTLSALAQASPQALEHAVALSGGLEVLHRWSADPLHTLTNPTALTPLLAQVREEASALAQALEVARRTLQNDPQQREALRLLMQTSLLLQRTLTALEGVSALAETAWSLGPLSEGFARQTEERLRTARDALDSAQKEALSLRLLLEEQKGRGEASIARMLAQALEGSAFSLERLETSLASAQQVVDFLWGFLGYDYPRTYLVIAQNQNEIRATGGFIGYVARFTLDKGILKDLVLHDSTEIDPEPSLKNPPPPDFIYWYLWMERLLFRDANWNPHFPASAAAVAEIYAQWTGVQVDGVIALTKALTLDVTGILGDVQVPGHSGPLTRSVAEEYTEGQRPYIGRGRPTRSYAPCEGKRCFDEDLFFALMERLRQGMPATVRQRLLDLLAEQVRRRNLLLHLFDPNLAPLVWEMGWNGAVRQVDHDYLMVIDNALPGHERKWARRSWEYRVALAVDRPLEASLRLRYTHGGAPLAETCRQADWKASTCYWNFFQVFLSRWAIDIDAPPVLLHEGTEKLAWGYTDAETLRILRHTGEGLTGLTEVGGYLTVESGTVVTVPLRYRLSPQVLLPLGEGRYAYRLLVQKQSAVDDDQIAVAVRLPEGAGLLQATPQPTQRQGQWLVWRTTLLADTTFLVVFAAPTPRG
ncbi:hypothetical protein HRbin23_00015 [bacterium HR23]|nr:hypothetical protein HRbin23_00015 [bacterium HR23]